MTDVVNIGLAPNDGTGDPVRTAFDAINTKLTELEAVTPTTISGLNALTLDNASVNERVAQGALIGNIAGQTDGTTLEIADPNEFRFQITGTRLEAGPWLLDTGSVDVTLRETITTGTQQIYNDTTLTITINRDAVTWPVVTPTVWAAPTAQGSGDGSTAANARALSTVAGTLTAGAVVGVRADLGTYDLAAASALTNSGAAGNPIKWIGVDSTGKRTLAKLNGGRWPYRKQTHDKEEVITLFTYADPGLDGVNAFGVGDVSYIDFEDLLFEDVQVCFNQTGANPSNLNFTRIHCRNVQRLYEHQSNTGHTDLSFDGITAFGFSKALIRIRGTATGTTVSNVYADAQRIDNDQWSSLSEIDNTATNFTFTNVTIRNCHDNRGNDYWNADGISTEETNLGGTFTNITSTGHTDAGIDLKTGATIIGGTIGDNKRNIKLWYGNSGDHSYHFENITLLPPNRRGGSGGACHLNFNHGPSVTDIIEARFVNMDFRLNGLAGASEIAYIDTSSVVIVKYINCLRDAAPAIVNDGPDNRYMIAASAPAGSPSLTISSANMTENATGSIALPSDRDADYGGVIIRSIGGTDAALFQIDGAFGTKQSISPVAPIAYTGTSADAKAITLTIEDIAGNQAVDVPFTVNIQQDTTDHRVLDVTFAGANGSQSATDVSPSAHALTWGGAATISTAVDPAGSLRVPFESNGNGSGRVSFGDSPDWDIPGPWTLLAENVRMDVAATGLRQTIAARNNNNLASMTWRLHFDETGHPEFIVHDSSGNSFTLTDPTARADATNYDLKVTRAFVSGATYQWDLWVDGVSVASVQNTVVPNDATVGIGIGATTASRDYMQGYIKRIAIYQGTASGA